MTPLTLDTTLTFAISNDRANLIRSQRGELCTPRHTGQYHSISRRSVGEPAGVRGRGGGLRGVQGQPVLLRKLRPSAGAGR